MSTLIQNVQKIVDAKTAISGAIEAKGVTVGNVSISNYASKIAQIPTGTSESKFYLPLNNSFTPSGQFEPIKINGKQNNPMDDMYSEDWGGNFESDQYFTYVLNFPDQSSTMEEYDGEWYPGPDTRNYWVEIPYIIEKLLVKEAWTIECWFKPGNKWGTSTQGQIIGCQRYGGQLFRISCTLNSTPAAVLTCDVNNVNVGQSSPMGLNSWVHLAVVRHQIHIRFYVNGFNMGEKLVSQFNLDSIQDYLKNDYLFSGFSTFSDYRIFKLAGIRFCDSAKYTQNFSPTPGPYSN